MVQHREGMILLEYQTMAFLLDVAHGGVLCTFRNRSAPGLNKWCGLSGQAAWTVHQVQNHTLLDYSPPASQAGRRVGPALYSLRPHWSYSILKGRLQMLWFMYSLYSYAVYFLVPTVFVYKVFTLSIVI